MRVGITTSIATAIAIGVLVAVGGGGGTANLWIDTSTGDNTCVRSASLVAYDSTKACSSLDAAYVAATLGDTVLVKTGDYPAETITDAPGKDTAGDAANVVFDEAPSETARFADLCLGTGVGSDDAPDHLTLRNFSDSGAAGACSGLPDQIAIEGGDANDILIENFDGGAFYVNGAQSLTIKGGDWGPCPDYDNISDLCDNSKIDTNSLNSNIVIDGIVMHDYTFGPNCDNYVGGTFDCHNECLFLAGTGTGFQLKNSWFYNCFIYDVFMQPGGTYDMTIENNWFGRSRGVTPGSTYPANVSRNTALIAATASLSNVLIRFNSFAPGQVFGNEDGIGSNVRFVGNISGASGSDNCIGGVTYNFNVWTAGTCGSNSTTQATLPYVNTDDQGAGNYHLSGAETQAPDNFVTTTTGDFALTTDKDGDTRPADSTTRDAGADER